MMTLPDKLKVLVDLFCEKNQDTIKQSDINKTLLRGLAFEAGMITIDHQAELMKSMKKDSANDK